MAHKLLVSRLLGKDAHAIQKLIDDETAVLTRLASPFTLKDAYIFIGLYNTLGIWVDDVLVGALEIKPSGETAYVVGKEYRGKGYCTQAIRAVNGNIFKKLLKVDRLWCLIHSENKASIRIAEKCGLEIVYVK
jgi:RimJ/RimL family protein N-acetyltransferase